MGNIGEYCQHFYLLCALKQFKKKASLKQYVLVIRERKETINNSSVNSSVDFGRCPCPWQAVELKD